MSAFLRKYNTLLVTGTTAIRIPIVKRGAVDFAVGADWTPAAGDVKIAIDGAAAANVTNLPTAVAMGNTAYWEFILTAAELSCKQAIVTVADAATKAVEDQAFIVETFGHASAMYAADWSLANLPANVTQLLGTAWLAPGTAGTPDVNVKLVAGTAQTAGDLAALLATIAGYIDTEVAAILAAVDTEIATLLSDLAAVKAKTDQLAFTVASRVDAQVLGVQSAAANLKKNAAFSAFEFVMTDSTNHNPATGLTVTAARSIDGAAFGACANAVAEVGSGVYKIDLAAADLNGNAITLRFTATGADDRLVTVITQP